ncbi:hypothetical protein [Lysobacter antibioticus]|uniref:Transmembrane protein n=1 Tax=Lysobacter antibioticus TaxID=84531 RepID=A0A0S2FBR5_LYSAN|nr:hypothetical protein [Lysobacter antibioticus]ALN80974.1 hypothetical protein LA76x_2844 [Lysobacter antibioticus]
MAKQDKFIAGFLVFQAAAGAATLVWQAIASGVLLVSVLIVVPVTIIAAFVAGIASFKGLAWARKLAIAVFAAQVLSFQTPWFFYSVWLGFQLSISVGWFDSGKIGINLVALAMLAWTMTRMKESKHPAGPDPLADSA